MKQKNVLDNNLRAEREEKRILEDNIDELRKRLREFQDGPDGINDLKNTIESQINMFHELKRVLLEVS